MPLISEPRLTHLKKLEAESIHIIREVAAEFQNPVMLYSIGKDSSVMLHLALKAFHPGKLPFPLLHVDTTWKFKEMITFRDNLAKELDLNLLVHTNQDGVKQNANPFDMGSSKYTGIMKTVALKQALDKYEFDAALAAPAATKRNPEPKKEFFPFATTPINGIPKINAPSFGTFTTPR